MEKMREKGVRLQPVLHRGPGNCPYLLGQGVV